jgi:aspartyl-tRNA(Asn)/glutamyl-tRNA(Gln) amidotransferase subunit A
MTALHVLGARALAAGIRNGELRAADVITHHLRRIAERDPPQHAFLEVFADQALAAAAVVDRDRAAGRALGPLAGVPVAIKDNLLREHCIAACGSRMLEHFVAPYSATAVARLERLGAIVVGRTNMDEFGMGSSTERSAFGPTPNPWAPDRVPGGSSGGSAAAVASDLCPLALGSDTGGSVRQPAALCGVSGLKPTYGRISRLGLVAYASSLDCVGLLARSTSDLALGLQIAGADDGDPTSAAVPVPDYAALPARADLRGLRIGVAREFAAAVVDAEVDDAVRAATTLLRERGAELVDCSLPAAEHAVATYYLVAAAEASSNLARYDGVRYGHRAGGDQRLDDVYAASRSSGFGAEVQLRILLGTFALQKGYQDQVYGQASRVRALLRRDFARAFAQCDLIASATSPIAAFPLGSRLQDPVAMYRCDALTVPASLAGLPALSVPCGTTRGGLPVGLQLTAPAFAEPLLLQVGDVYQRATDWHRRRPAP